MIELPSSDTLFMAWLAGFFDGEGCVTVRSKQLSGRTVDVATVVITQANYEILEAIRTRVGCGKVYARSVQNVKWKPSWNFTVCRAKDKIRFLTNLLPFLQLKRRDAELGIHLAKEQANRSRCSPKPVCRNGHVRTERNTYTNLRTGKRQCKICAAEWEKSR